MQTIPQLKPLVIPEFQQAEIERIAAEITPDTLIKLGLAEANEISDTILASVGADFSELTPAREVREKIDPAYRRLFNIYLALQLKIKQHQGEIFASMLAQRVLAIHTCILTVWILDQRLAGVPFPQAFQGASDHLLFG